MGDGRKTIYGESIAEIECHDHLRTIAAEVLLAWLSKQVRLAGAAGFTNLRVHAEVDDYGVDGYTLMGDRPETDEEKADRERAAREDEEYEREQRYEHYLAFKREFEPEPSPAEPAAPAPEVAPPPQE